MQAFHIHYRNTQGTLMRILTAVSRRALDLTYVHAEAESNGEIYNVMLVLEVNAKQVGQLRRDWFAIADVTDVRMSSGDTLAEHVSSWTGSAPHPPAPTRGEENARAARA